MGTRVTMHEVAQAAGVSTKTVSNVLRGAGGASQSTRQRVLETATRLGYRSTPARPLCARAVTAPSPWPFPPCSSRSSRTSPPSSCARLAI